MLADLGHGVPGEQDVFAVVYRPVGPGKAHGAAADMRPHDGGDLVEGRSVLRHIGDDCMGDPQRRAHFIRDGQILRLRCEFRVIEGIGLRHKAVFQQEREICPAVPAAGDGAEQGMDLCVFQNDIVDLSGCLREHLFGVVRPFREELKPRDFTGVETQMMPRQQTANVLYACCVIGHGLKGIRTFPDLQHLLIIGQGQRRSDQTLRRGGAGLSAGVVKHLHGPGGVVEEPGILALRVENDIPSGQPGLKCEHPRKAVFSGLQQGGGDLLPGQLAQGIHAQPRHAQLPILLAEDGAAGAPGVLQQIPAEADAFRLREQGLVPPGADEI